MAGSRNLGWGEFFRNLGRGRKVAQPHRDTIPFPNIIQIGQQNPQARVLYKPTPRNIRYFSRTPYARRAINAIKNPISMLDWEIVPIKGVKWNSELRRQAEVTAHVLNNPNHDDDFRTFWEQIVEDIMAGAGAIEIGRSSDPDRPLWLWPVDGLSIQTYPAWTGNPVEARWAQSVGYGSYTGGGPTVLLRDDELVYIAPNPNTFTPFGIGPLEIAFNSIARQLGVGEYAGNIATNAKPNAMIDLGEGADEKTLQTFRSYWTNEIEGQGKTPIVGTKNGKVTKLYPDGDDAVFLLYQEFMIREIGTSFDLSPQNFGLEKDVNRSTADASKDRDWNQAIKPMAHSVSASITRGVIRKGLGFTQLRHKFVALDVDDERLLAEVYGIEYRNNAITPNEYRAKRGMDPMKSEWADRPKADVDIASKAVNNMQMLLDPDDPSFGKMTIPPDPDKKDT